MNFFDRLWLFYAEYGLFQPFLNYFSRLWIISADYRFFTPFMAFYKGHGFYTPQSPDAGANALFSDSFSNNFPFIINYRN